MDTVPRRLPVIEQSRKPSDPEEADSDPEYQDAEVDLQSPSKDSGIATEVTLAPMRSKTFEHPLYKGDKFELRAGAEELGLVLTVPHGKKVSVRFSVDRWANVQEVQGELLGPGADSASSNGRMDQVYFRVPVGRDAIRVTSAGEGRGGVDFAVRYHDVDEDTA